MRNSGIPLSSFPKKIQDQISAQLHGARPPTDCRCVPIPVPADKPRLRQNTTGPNKTELEFEMKLHAEHGAGQIHRQAITLRLANGLRYTPDFVKISDATNEHAAPVSEWTAWEVKGFMRDDAAGKIKMAAALYPLIRFYLASKRKKKAGGGWAIQEILP